MTVEAMPGQMSREEFDRLMRANSPPPGMGRLLPFRSVETDHPVLRWPVRKPGGQP
jgi:hypothetical protein